MFKICLKDTYKLLFFLGLFIQSLLAQNIVIGAAQFNTYGPHLSGKRVGVIANHTSYVGDEHLVDYLLGKNVAVVKIFAPEHGFRGSADAGAEIQDGLDPTTGLPVLSLYGKNKKPSPAMLAGLDILVFDIQDVGVRFYTYISTMSYSMEAAAEQGLPFLVLDRPNPNGHYVDGPILKAEHASFVGLHPVPIVHGMTIAEYAKMLNGKGWLKDGVKCELTVVPCLNYRREMVYELPIPPSPNLRSQNAIYLYPSLCLFEGTDVSVGRGTEMPFEIYGAPWFADTFSFSFVPNPNLGASQPMHQYDTCFGRNLTSIYVDKRPFQLDLSFLYLALEQSSDKQRFFNPFFLKLVGDTAVKGALLEGVPEVELRSQWGEAVLEFLEVRRPYLLYD